LPQSLLLEDLLFLRGGTPDLVRNVDIDLSCENWLWTRVSIGSSLPLKELAKFKPGCVVTYCESLSLGFTRAFLEKTR
jgi:hypothetical protein